MPTTQRTSGPAPYAKPQIRDTMRLVTHLKPTCLCHSSAQLPRSHIVPPWSRSTNCTVSTSGSASSSARIRSAKRR